MKLDNSFFNGRQIKVMMKGPSSGNGDSMVEGSEMEAIRARVDELEEAEKWKMLQSQKEKQPNLQGFASLPSKSIADQVEVDERSVYVGNVDRYATTEDLEQYFRGCGVVKRVTMLYNLINDFSKGAAFVEFGSKDSVPAALELNDSFFKTRRIRVAAKRTDIPRLTTSNRGLSGTRGRGSVHGGRPFAHSSGFRPTRPNTNTHRGYYGETYSPY